MNTIRKIEPVQNTTSSGESASRLDIVKKVIIAKFLEAMFDPAFGISDYLNLTETELLDEFSRQFLPHAKRAIRIALNLKEEASCYEVKQALVRKIIDVKRVPDQAKLMGMPPGVTINDVKAAQKELTPQFAVMFGLNETVTEDELQVASNLVLGILQREKYSLKPDSPDEQLFAVMTK